MTPFFLRLTASFAFLALCAISGYMAAGSAQTQCYAIATVVKIAGLCDAPQHIRFGERR